MVNSNATVAVTDRMVSVVRSVAAPGCLAAGQQALAQDGAEVLILGGGPVTGLSGQLVADLGVPVLDGVACATKLAESPVACGHRTSRRGVYQIS